MGHADLDLDFSNSVAFSPDGKQVLTGYSLDEERGPRAVVGRPKRQGTPLLHGTFRTG